MVKEVNRQRLIDKEAMAEEDKWMLEIDLDHNPRWKTNSIGYMQWRRLDRQGHTP